MDNFNNDAGTEQRWRYSVYSCLCDHSIKRATHHTEVRDKSKYYGLHLFYTGRGERPECRVVLLMQLKSRVQFVAETHSETNYKPQRGS